MKSKIINTLLISIELAIILGSVLSSCNKAKIGHNCEYKQCPYKGLTVFNKSVAEFPDHAASYTLDSLHFVSPKLDYDQEIELLEQNNITVKY